MRGQAGVLARENAALIRDESLEQVRVLVIEGIRGKVNFRFRARRARFAISGAATTFVFLRTSFARHSGLLDFLVQGMTAQRGIVFSNLELLRLELLVAGGGVARRRFAFLPRFGAFDGDDFPGHKL